MMESLTCKYWHVLCFRALCQGGHEHQSMSTMSRIGVWDVAAFSLCCVVQDDLSAGLDRFPPRGGQHATAGLLTASRPYLLTLQAG